MRESVRHTRESSLSPSTLFVVLTLLVVAGFLLLAPRLEIVEGIQRGVIFCLGRLMDA